MRSTRVAILSGRSLLVLVAFVVAGGAAGFEFVDHGVSGCGVVRGVVVLDQIGPAALDAAPLVAFA